MNAEISINDTTAPLDPALATFAAKRAAFSCRTQLLATQPECEPAPHAPVQFAVQTSSAKARALALVEDCAIYGDRLRTTYAAHLKAQSRAEADCQTDLSIPSTSVEVHIPVEQFITVLARHSLRTMENQTAAQAALAT